MEFVISVPDLNVLKKKKKKELMREEDGRKNKIIMLTYYMTAFTFSLVFVCDSGVMPKS